jgi:hypothetical protein
MCHEWKPEADFAFRSIETGKRQSHCRKCHAAYRRQHYLNNRAEYIAREVARIASFRLDNRFKLFEYLSKHPCVDCGEADVLVLEFDHRDPATKRREIGYLAARKAWHLVAAEIAKCDVRCVNCHRRRTARQQNWSKARGGPPDSEHPIDASSARTVSSIGETRDKRCRVCGGVKPASEFAIKNKRTGRRATICRSCQAAYGREHYRRTKPAYLARGKKNKESYRRQNRQGILQYLAGRSCIDCGESDPVVLEFDHRDGVEKEAEVGRLIGSGQWATVAAEIAKCDVRCGNCHRRRTADQFAWLKRRLQIALQSIATKDNAAR